MRTGGQTVRRADMALFAVLRRPLKLPYSKFINMRNREKEILKSKRQVHRGMCMKEVTMDRINYENLTRNSTEQYLRLKRLRESETGHEQINVKSRTM